MSRPGKILRHVLVWWLPGLAILALLLASLVYWLLGTQQGTRLLLTTAAEQFEGQALGVRGTVLGGLSADRLTLSLPDLALDITELRLNVRWGALGGRLLHVRELSAGSIHVALSGAEHAADAADTAFQMPDLPLAITIDRLAVADFSLLRNGESLPVSVADLQAALRLDNAGAHLSLDSLTLGHEIARLALQGKADLNQLSDPWPLEVRLNVTGRGMGEDSPLCRYSAQVDAAASKFNSKPGNNEASKPEAAAPDAAACQFTAQAELVGSLDQASMVLNLQGSGLSLAAQAALVPRASFPLRSASLELHQVAHEGSVSASATWQPAADASGRDHLQATLAADRLELGRLLQDILPPAFLNVRASLDLELQDQRALRQLSVDLTVAEGSHWNRQPLAVVLKGQADFAARLPQEDGELDRALALALAKLRIHGLELDARLGGNRVRAQGDWATDQGALSLSVAAPQLDAFWPGLSGAAELRASLSGNAARHSGELSAAYTPPNPRAGMLGESRAQASLAFTGAWGFGTDADAALEGWRGTLSRIRAETAGFSLSADRPLAVSVLPYAEEPRWQWQVGQAGLTLAFPAGQRMQLQHGGSRGVAQRWETAGRADNLVISAVMVRQLMRALGRQDGTDIQRVNAPVPDAQRRIALDANWDLRFAGTLSGRARLARRSGDLRIPGDPPIPLGLQTAALEITATPVTAKSSRLDARLDVRTASMGRINGSGSATLVTRENGAMELDSRQSMRASLDADISNLAWLSLLLGDAIEVGGTLRANVEIQGVPGGVWRTRGTMRGEQLRVIRIDDGVRLLDGTLSARFDNDRLILESLRFPASLRAVPSEWRTREWITKEPDAQNGYIEAVGQWNLFNSEGQVRVVLHRFPVMQRSDRYAMASGQIDIVAALPRLSITGELTADAGWVSLEVLRGVPTLDDDVIVRRPGDAAKPNGPPMQVSMRLKVDMGPRFYLTGLGLDAGLIGSMVVQLSDGRLTGIGSLSTRAGGIEAYGQRLRLRRGTITFQGNLENPLLDIEALRTGEQVEAGVRVSGTAQRPRIDLVSHPDVSDVEKLSWLILGRGPDEGGGDAALLVSVGAALLGGGQPFYRQLGLTDLSVRSGAIGSSGSLLPDRTVAGNVNRDSSSQLATQFLVASKMFTNGITLSMEQALSGSDWVARVSYLLSRRWSVDARGGSINGLALVYRTFFED